LQAGLMTPQQSGIELPMDFSDQETPFMSKLKSAENIAKMRGTSTTGVPGKPAANKMPGSPGRPKNSKDTVLRKPKLVKPVGASGEDANAMFLTNLLWTKEIAQSRISDMITPALLQHYGKASGRALSDEQAKQVEEIKFAVLCNVEPYSDVTPDIVNEILHTGAKVPEEYRRLYDALYTQVAVNNKKEPTVDEVRTIQASVYALMNFDEEYIYGKSSDNS